MGRLFMDELISELRKMNNIVNVTLLHQKEGDSSVAFEFNKRISLERLHKIAEQSGLNPLRLSGLFDLSISPKIKAGMSPFDVFSIGYSSLPKSKTRFNIVGSRILNGETRRKILAVFRKLQMN